MRDKAERKSQRKLEKQSGSPDDANELERFAQEQAALFRIADDEAQNVHPKDSSDDDLG